MIGDKTNIVEICTTFHKTWKQQQEEQQKGLEETYDTYKKELQQMHEKTENMYKILLQWMIEQVKHNESNEFINTIEDIIKDVNEYPWKMDVYTDVLKEAKDMLLSKKNPRVIEDKRQWPFGKKPLYFDFMDL